MEILAELVPVSGDPMLRIWQRDLPQAHSVMRGALQGVFLVWWRLRLRPELRIPWCPTQREWDEVVFLEGCRGADVAVGPHLPPLERVGVRRGWAEAFGMRDRTQLRRGKTTVSGPKSAGGVGFPCLRVDDVDVPGVAAPGQEWRP